MRLCNRYLNVASLTYLRFVRVKMLLPWLGTEHAP